MSTVRTNVFDFNDKENYDGFDFSTMNSDHQKVDQEDKSYQVSNKVLSFTKLDQIYEDAFKINPSPLNPEKFRQFLNGYDEFEKSQLLYDLTHGVRVPSSYSMPDACSIPDNHSSAYKYRESVDEKIKSNLEKGWVAGPFDNRPANLVISPLASIPKRD